jgi:hypothetical protein
VGTANGAGFAAWNASGEINAISILVEQVSEDRLAVLPINMETIKFL